MSPARPAAILLWLLLAVTGAWTATAAGQSAGGAASVWDSLSPAVRARIGKIQLDRVLDTLQRNGTARVLVRAAMPIVPAAAARGGARRIAIAASQSDLLARLKPRRTQRVRRLGLVPVVSVQVDAEEFVRLLLMREVRSVAEDALLEPTLTTSVPQVGADQLWAGGYEGLGQAIAVLDTGVEPVPGVLDGRIVAEACFSSHDPDAGDNSLCPGQVIQSTAQYSAAPCTDLVDCDHGTLVASAAAGDHPTYRGVAPGANIIAVQVFTRVTDNAACQGAGQCLRSYTSDLLLALEHVHALTATYPIAAVNMSLGGAAFEDTASCLALHEETGLREIFDLLWSAGTAVVVSAGNHGADHALSTPGCLPRAVTVGSVNPSDVFDSTSDTASWLDLAAPGRQITTIGPDGNAYTVRGTSFAAPHVSGALALLRTQFPGAGPEELLAALRLTGVPVTEPGTGLEFPRLQVDAAADALWDLAPGPVEIVVDDEDPGVVVETGQVLVEAGPLASAPYRGTALRSDGSQPTSVRFPLDVPVAGVYRIDGWWPLVAGNPSAITYEVTHALGVSSATVDQDLPGARWTRIGDFALDPAVAGAVRVLSDTAEQGVADALRAVYLSQDPLVLQPTPLAGAERASTYEQALQASGGRAPYSWAVVSGALPVGVGLGSASGVLSGVPGEAGQFAFTARVTDASGQADERAFVLDVAPGNAPPDTLLGEDFSGGLPPGWTPVDDGTIGGPSQWTVANGVLEQRSTIRSNSVQYLGSWLHYFPGSGWTDYRFESTLTSDRYGIGVLFRIQDSNDYYRFIWDRNKGFRRLVRHVNGVATVLAEDAVPYGRNVAHRVAVTAAGAQITVDVDGATVFSVTDGTHRGGSIALFSWNNPTARFDDIAVTAIDPGANQAPEIDTIGADPAQILDTGTSQLSVSAHDTDGGPGSLTYLWQVAPGEGSVDPPTSPTPTYTPPQGLSSTQVYTVSVEVSDGADTTTATVDVTVDPDPGPGGGGLLLDEDFSGGLPGAWSAVDDGTMGGPSQWAVASGVLEQRTTIRSNSLAYLGTWLHYLPGSGWTDYRFESTLTSDRYGIGVLFRIQDADDYYRFIWDRNKGFRRLVRHVNGVATVLAEDAVPYGRNVAHRVAVTAAGAQLTVEVDGATVFSVVDAAHPAGSVALFSWNNPTARFDDIAVTALAAGANQAPVVDTIGADPDQILDTETSQLSVSAHDPDGGSETLTYLWQLAPGEGSVDPPTSATPTYTPPDVASTRVFTATVEVSDGEANATATVDITVDPDPGPGGGPGVLLTEDFAGNGAVPAGWSAVDDGYMGGASNWLRQENELRQLSTNRSGTVQYLGTWLRYDAGSAWTDYRLETTLGSGNNGVGIMFRISGPGDYYRLAWDRNKGFRRLTRHSGGVTTVLAEDTVLYQSERLYRVVIDAEGPAISVQIDGATVFSVNDATHAAGTVALFTWNNATARFDDVSVTSIGATASANQGPVVTAIAASPAQILDTATSRLSIAALDPDGGPQPLSYLWALEPDAGRIDDPQSSTPRYYPPDVDGPRAFNLSAWVSDGSSSSTRAMTVQVADDPALPHPSLLLAESFSGAGLDGWQSIDGGGIGGASLWQAAAGALLQLSAIRSNSDQYLGTYLQHDAGSYWTNYRLETSMSSQNNGIGVMFRVTGDGSYYRFAWDRSKGFRRLTRHHAGKVEVLAEDQVPYEGGRTYRLAITADGTRIEVRIDGQSVFTVTDPVLRRGTIALFTWNNTSARFEDLTVQRIGTASDQLPLVHSVMASPVELLETESTQLAVTATDPESGDAALTYRWDLPAQGGTLSDPTSRTPVYTPPDVSGLQELELTVHVSDGAGTVTSRTRITTADASPVVHDSFETGNLFNWDIYDDGNIGGPSAWASAGGVLTQGSTIRSGSVQYAGTRLVHRAGYAWGDYRLLTRVASRRGGIGVVFRARENGDHYRFVWDGTRAFRRLTRHSGGVTTLLGEDFVGYESNRRYDLEVQLEGDYIKVLVDRVVVFAVEDGAIARGSAGLFTWDNPTAEFDDFSVIASHLPVNRAPVVTEMSSDGDGATGGVPLGLAAAAHDPDGGPLALSYEWSVGEGAGTLSGANAARASFVPADLVGPHRHEVLLRVSDGRDTVEKRITVAAGSNRPIGLGCEPLPPPGGAVVRVNDYDSLKAALRDALPGDTILLENGRYAFKSALRIATPGLTIRSASSVDSPATSRPSDVVLDGEYRSEGIFLVAASDATIAHMTLMRVKWHLVQVTTVEPGLDVTGTHLFSLLLMDPRQQFVKINQSAEDAYSDYGRVECSHFELTDIGRPRIDDLFSDACYTGGIDAHKARGWVIRRNLFRNIYCSQTMNRRTAEHAVHFWSQSRDTVVEGNVILNCERGIGFGLSSGKLRDYPDDPYPGLDASHYDGLIRNNVVYADIREYDTGIALWRAPGARVYHNTVYSTGTNRWGASIEVRFPESVVDVRNNLMTEFLPRHGGQAVPYAGNMVGVPAVYFVNPGAADGFDFSLTPGAVLAEDAGVPLPEVASDLDGSSRHPVAPDIGAIESP